MGLLYEITGFLLEKYKVIVRFDVYLFMFTIEVYLYFSNGLSKILELAKARTFRECGNCSKAGSINETESVVSANTSAPTVATGHLKMSKMENNNCF